MSQGEASEPEEVYEPKRATFEVIKTGLSRIAPTFDGSSYAFTKLSLPNLELDELTEDIKGYQHLRYVDLSQNNIVNIAMLANIPHILQLECRQNKIFQIEFFSVEDVFPYLQLASLESNAITRLPALKQPKLRRINLNNNLVDSTEYFEGHPALQLLEMRGNRLTNLQGLKEMPVLQELYLAENQISSLHGLENLPMLKVLHLRKNAIQDFGAEEELPDLPSLEVLNLRETKILPQPKEFAKLQKKYTSLKKLVLLDTPFMEEFVDKSKVELILVLPRMKIFNKDEITEEDREDAHAEAEERYRREEEARLEAERAAQEAQNEAAET